MTQTDTRKYQKTAGWISSLLGLRFLDASEVLYDLPDLRTLREYRTRDHKEYFMNPDEDHCIGGTLPAYTVRHIHGHSVYTPRLRDIDICTELEETTAPQLIHDLSRALDGLPPYVSALFAEWSLKLKLGRRMKDLAPDSATIKARSHDCIQECLSSHYDPCTNTVNTAQEVRDGESNLYVLAIQSVYEVALHELGHALDQILDITDVHGRNSRYCHAYQKDLIKAYRHDVTQLRGSTCHEGTDLCYFLVQENGGDQEKENAACSEVFAQLFAEHLIKGDDQPLRHAFPGTQHCMEKILKSLEKEINSTPDLGRICVPIRYRTPYPHVT